MYKFSESSKKRLSTCDDQLQDVFNTAIEIVDCSILCGYRGYKEQTEAFNSNHSTVQFPHSKHNVNPSKGVDALPCPVDWNDILRIKNFACIVKSIAKSKGIKIEWGGDWKNFKDYAHWQI